MTADRVGEVRIGFLGIGAMGLPMAKNLHAAGYSVTAFDPSERQRALAHEAGMVAVDQIAELANSDVLLIMVATGDQLLGLVDESALFDVSARVRTAIVTSTVGPIALQSFSERVGALGVDVIDLAVTGGVAGAVGGRLTLLAGAPGTLIDGVSPILEPLGQVVHCGDRPGDGQAVKLVNNLLAAVNLAAVAESVRFAKDMGLDAEKVLRFVENGAAASWMLSDRGPRMVKSRAERVFDTHTSIFAKDTALIASVAADVGVAVPLLDVVRGQFASAMELGWSAEDDSCIADLDIAGASALGDR
jgi:3-hydroxyisobutyrate dehydrogenase